jgi:hypothetical protein
MEGTVRLCLKLGYTQEQAELIGRIDDDFEGAIKLGLLSDEEAIQCRQQFARFTGKRTGKQMA